MSTNIEFEGKVLEINEKNILKKLGEQKAKFIGEYTQKRYVFNTIPFSENRWVRLRSNGEKTTLAVKEIGDDSVSGTSEWEINVSDFEETLEILKKIGIKPKGYQENRRIEYLMNNCQITLDFWPKIPVYLEIEGKNESEVYDCAEKLGIDKKDITGMNTTKIYKKYGIDLDRIEDLRF